MLKQTGRMGARKYLRKVVATALNTLQLTFWPHLCGEDPLNNAALTTTTHRKPERVSDGTSTQVVA